MLFLVPFGCFLTAVVVGLNCEYNFGGFDAPDSDLTGPETRTSSPVRVARGEDLQATRARGLWPCGEGAGYAGGITSAAVDGLRVAEGIIGECAPPD